VKILSSKLLQKLVDECIELKAEPTANSFMMLAKEYLRLYEHAEAITYCVRNKKHPAELQYTIKHLVEEMP
jgi:hypothetical protein